MAANDCGKIINPLILDGESQGGVSIEGLAHRERLHPIQQAFMEHAAIQCGFCIPGMIMSAYAFLNENPDRTVDEIKEAVAGNLCRCTDYTKIVEAIQAVAQSGQLKGRCLEIGS